MKPSIAIHMFFKPGIFNFGCILLVGLVLSNGCSNTVNVSSEVQALNQTNMQRLLSCYKAFQHRNRYIGPSDETEFRNFILNENHAKTMSRIGIDTDQVDKLFLNERDGEPFTIRYGIKGGAMALDVQPIVFEKVGIDGKRMAAFIDGSIREAQNAEQFDSWINGDYESESED